MALKALSGAVYHDTAKNVPKPDVKTNEGNLSDPGTMKISAAQTPALSKSSESSQGSFEQEKSKNSAVDEKKIKNAISRANSNLKTHRTRCEFSYHEETKRITIKIYDKETEEVIREIPPEETLEMIEKMWELAGLLIDERR